jgi:hypothetical protein
MPDSINPRKRGIAEQEQKGVTIPSEAAITLPVKSDLPSSAFRVLSGEKYVRIIPTKNIISVSNINTLGNSKIKKRILSVR